MKNILFKTAVAVAAMVGFADQASAVSFATFTSTGLNTRWVNSGATGKNGNLYATDNATATVAGSNSGFLLFQNTGTALDGVNAAVTYVLDAATILTAAVNPTSTTIRQDISYGGIEFTYTGADVVVGTATLRTGDKVLSALFGAATLSGAKNGTTSILSASGVGYSSSVLDFTQAVSSSLTFTLAGNATNKFSALANKAVSNYRSNLSASFDSEPTPLIDAVPDVATWATMIVGLGLVGVAGRRKRLPVVTA